MADPARPPDAFQRKDKAKTFFFIHGAKACSNARTHAMRGYLQQKRSQQKGNHRSTLRILKSASPASTDGETRPGTNHGENRTPILPQSTITTASVSSTNPATEMILRHGSPASPQKPLDSGTLDPFETLPLTLGRPENVLFHHFMYVLPRRVYGPRDGGIFYNRLGLMFPEAMENATCFQLLILGYAATHRAFLQGKATTLETETHHTRAVTMLRQYFQLHPSDIGDRAIYLVLAQSSHDGASSDPERQQAANMHLDAAMRMIRLRGGPQTFYKNRRMTAFFSRHDYGNRSYRPTMSPTIRDHNLYSTHEPTSIIDECDNFINFLLDVHISAPIIQRRCTRSPQYLSLFRPHGPIYLMLSPCPGNTEQDVSIRVQMTSTLAILMLLHHALLEHAKVPSLLNRYIVDLATSIVQYRLDLAPSITLLLEVLIFGSEDGLVYSPSSPWEVGRLLRIAKRLTLWSWERLRIFLSDTLTKETFNDQDKFDFHHWMEELRTEILTAPASAKVMPALVEMEEELQK